MMSGNGPKVLATLLYNYKTYKLTKPRTLIGAGNSVDIRIIDPLVAKSHVEIHFIPLKRTLFNITDEQFTSKPRLYTVVLKVFSSKSTMKVYLNNQPVINTIVLKDQDVIMFGNKRHIFVFNLNAEAEKSPEAVNSPVTPSKVASKMHQKNLMAYLTANSPKSRSMQKQSNCQYLFQKTPLRNIESKQNLTPLSQIERRLREGNIKKTFSPTVARYFGQINPKSNIILKRIEKMLDESSETSAFSSPGSENIEVQPENIKVEELIFQHEPEICIENLQEKVTQSQSEKKSEPCDSEKKVENISEEIDKRETFFQHFQKNADDLESWINENLKIASDEPYKDSDNPQAEIQKHQVYEAKLKTQAKERFDELHRLLDLMFSKLHDKGKKLQQALMFMQFPTDCDELLSWIKNKETFFASDDIDHELENEQQKFDEFKKDMASQEFRINEIDKKAAELIQAEHTEKELINLRAVEVHDAWARLLELKKRREKKLFDACEIQKFNRDADEAILWINEKDAIISTDNYGRELVSVQNLQQKYEGIENDLNVLREKIDLLSEEADHLCEKHPNLAEQILAKQKKIGNAWKQLQSKSEERRIKLEHSYLLQKYLSDYRDLSSWIQNMKMIISSNELSEDVASAEAQLG